MAISEKQFEEMIKGTVHEGKYDKSTEDKIADGFERGATRLTIKVLLWRIAFMPQAWLFALIFVAVAWPFLFGAVYHWSRYPERSRWGTVGYGLVSASIIIFGTIFPLWIQANM